MKQMLLSATALLGLAVSVTAEVPNGSTWIGGGHSVTLGVVQHSTPNTVTVTATDSEGSSQPVTGTPGSGSTEEKPTVEETPGGGVEGSPMTTPGDDGTSYRAEGGKMQYKGSDGTWRTMRLKKDPKPGSMQRLVVGQPAPHAGQLYSRDGRTTWLVQGQLAPWTGWFGPGEELTGLPAL